MGPYTLFITVENIKFLEAMESYRYCRQMVRRSPVVLCYSRSEGLNHEESPLKRQSVSDERRHTQFVTRLDQSNNSSARHKSYQSIYEGYFTSNLRQSFILKLFRGDRELTLSSRSRGHVERLKVVKVVVGSGY